MTEVEVRLADYHDAAHADALVDCSMRTPAIRPAVAYARRRMPCAPACPTALAARPQAFSVIAFDGPQPVGLVNCIEGFSTFACRPLVNVHDVMVLQSHRGQRIAQRMLARVEEEAVARGACKLTLEVLQGNAPALRAYEREGFAGYQLDPAFGAAVFLQKTL
jgi:GNAT superfamily N-acetyltransferase